MNSDLRTLLEDAHNQGVEPTPVPARNSQGVRLNLDSRKIALMSAQGKATAAGRYWYNTLKEKAVPDARWDDDAKTYRKPGGRTDFVKMRNGAEVQLRTWEPNKKDYKYTRLGEVFYKRRPKQYIVQVPVRIYVRRRNGTETYYDGTYPAADFNEDVRRELNSVSRPQDIKRKILQHVGDRGLYKGSQIVAEFSDQTIVLREGEWSMAWQETNFNAQGNIMSTTAVMDRPLNGWRWPCKQPETALEEAWEGEGNCVIRQLAKTRQDKKR